MIKAVLFDMDGVLVDSEKYICEAAIKMFAENGITAKEEDFLPFVGTGENRYLGGVAEKYNFVHDIETIKSRTYAIYAEIVHLKLVALPGVHTFIAKCKELGLKIAVATSADEVKMLVNLKEVGVPAETFDTTVNGLQVERKKPFPDIYIKAAKQLGVSTTQCLVVEDAISGIEAALNAGCRCLALTTSFPREKLTRANWICKDLSEYPNDAIDW